VGLQRAATFFVQKRTQRLFLFKNEPGKLLATAATLFLVRKRRTSFWLSLSPSSVTLYALSILIWALFIQLINERAATWKEKHMTADRNMVLISGCTWCTEKEVSTWIRGSLPRKNDLEMRKRV
jgi:hypothetical protein